ncbi:MAG: 8-oxo-dGTP diphosphatase, partial [Halobacteriales archaeon]
MAAGRSAGTVETVETVGYLTPRPGDVAMSPRDVNLAEIERRRDRLFDRYGEAPVRERHDAPDPETFEEWRAMSEAGYIGSAYALVRRTPDQLPPLSETMAVEGEERERVLLILVRGGSKWGVPGGGQEGEESFEATARREVAEEVNLDVTLTGIDHLRHEIATCEGYDDRLHVIRVFFTADYAGGSIALQPGELQGAAWFADPPAE